MLVLVVSLEQLLFGKFDFAASNVEGHYEGLSIEAAWKIKRANGELGQVSTFREKTKLSFIVEVLVSFDW